MGRADLSRDAPRSSGGSVAFVPAATRHVARGSRGASPRVVTKAPSRGCSRSGPPRPPRRGEGRGAQRRARGPRRARSRTRRTAPSIAVASCAIHALRIAQDAARGGSRRWGEHLRVEEARRDGPAARVDSSAAAAGGQAAWGERARTTRTAKARLMDRRSSRRARRFARGREPPGGALPRRRVGTNATDDAMSEAQTHAISPARPVAAQSRRSGIATQKLKSHRHHAPKLLRAARVRPLPRVLVCDCSAPRTTHHESRTVRQPRAGVERARRRRARAARGAARARAVAFRSGAARARGAERRRARRRRRAMNAPRAAAARPPRRATAATG